MATQPQPICLSLQRLRQRGNRRVDQRCTAPLIEPGDNRLARRRNRDVNGNAADLGQRLGLFLRDSLLRQPLAPLQCLLEIAGCLRGDSFGFSPGVGEDRLCFRRRLALLLLIGGERLLGFLAKSARGFELISNARSTGIEPAENGFARRLPNANDEGRDGQQDPEFGFGKKMHRQAARSAIARSTAGISMPSSTAEPVSFSVTERATSTATFRISPKARSLAAAISRSAALVWSASASASCRCRSAASAANRSERSLIVACASARASAIVF